MRTTLVPREAGAGQRVLVDDHPTGRRPQRTRSTDDEEFSGPE